VTAVLSNLGLEVLTEGKTLLFQNGIDGDFTDGQRLGILGCILARGNNL
jgi:hypothetical protein